MKPGKIRRCVAHGRIVCTCGILLDKCNCTGYIPITDRMECIHWQTTRQLFDEIVDQTVKNIEIPPGRVLSALIRIGQEDKIRIADLFQRYVDEVGKHDTVLKINGRVCLPGTMPGLRIGQG